MRLIVSGCCLFGLLAISLAAHALPVWVIEPSQDNTLYETDIDSGDTLNERSNGAGNFLFAGRTGLDAGFRLRRAVLKFDLSVLPPGAEIVSVQLTVYQSKAAPNSPPAEMGLHRLLQEWGEGDSKAIAAEGQGDFATPNDATWHHRLYPDQDWETPGGHFQISPSATMTVGQNLQHYTWTCTPGLLADLQTWLQQPELNFGWIIVGGEIAGQSAHRFNSRENSTIEQRPKLRLIYKTPGSGFHDGFEAGPPCG